MDQLLQTFRNLGPRKLAAIGGVAVVMLGFFVYLVARMGSTDMDLLYSDLDTRDSGQIVQRLEAMNVPFEVQQGGTRLLVPAGQVDRLRLAMAQDGLPRGGSLGYELFDDSDGFGTTNFVQNINRLRAMEGELARTIASIDAISSARVHLVLSERELFSRDRQQPTASVFVRLATPDLSPQQINAIRNLVATSVPRMDPGSVAIIDDRGNLLASGPTDEDELRIRDAEDMRRAYERELRQRLEELLARSVGYGRVRAQVSAEMDFDRVTVNEERYDPDSAVPRSTQFVEEEREITEGDGIDPVTVAANLPEPDAQGLFGGAGARERSSRLEETTNFEISRVIQNSIRETGSVRRLSVAVLIDGSYQRGPDGEMEYQPRGAEEMQQLEALVRSAIGFSDARGDQLHLTNLRFVTPDDEMFGDAVETLFGIPRDDVFRIIEMVVLAIVAVLVILLVVRPLLARVLESSGKEEEADQAALEDLSGMHPALMGPDGSTPAFALEGFGGDDEEPDQLIDLNKVEGRVRASSLKKVGEIIDRHPEEAVSIIRNWMYQES